LARGSADAGPGGIALAAGRGVGCNAEKPQDVRRLNWWQSEGGLKPSTLASYREAIELYFAPGLGHIRLADLRPDHFRDLYAAMRLINRPGEPPRSLAETLRRLTQARATARREPGRLASTRPLSEARIKRIHAVARAALSDLVPHTLSHNPAAAVKLGGKRGGRTMRPLLWTEPRVARWRETTIPQLQLIRFYYRRHPAWLAAQLTIIAVTIALGVVGIIAGNPASAIVCLILATALALAALLLPAWRTRVEAPVKPTPRSRQPDLPGISSVPLGCHQRRLDLPSW
jgi:Phage integrase, N-terminal SAM-like domain